MEGVVLEIQYEKPYKSLKWRPIKYYCIYFSLCHLFFVGNDQNNAKQIFERKTKNIQFNSYLANSIHLGTHSQQHDKTC